MNWLSNPKMSKAYAALNGNVLELEAREGFEVGGYIGLCVKDLDPYVAGRYYDVGKRAKKSIFDVICSHDEFIHYASTLNKSDKDALEALANCTYSGMHEEREAMRALVHIKGISFTDFCDIAESRQHKISEVVSASINIEARLNPKNESGLPPIGSFAKYHIANQYYSDLTELHKKFDGVKMEVVAHSGSLAILLSLDKSFSVACNDQWLRLISPYEKEVTESMMEAVKIAAIGVPEKDKIVNAFYDAGYRHVTESMIKGLLAEIPGDSSKQDICEHLTKGLKL